MPHITLKETITKRIEIPIDSVIEMVESLNEEERMEVMRRLQARPLSFKNFNKDSVDNILQDFAETKLYEEDFLTDLKEGLKKSSPYR
jgi:DNA-binding transcriptional ArsR family regulator